MNIFSEFKDKVKKFGIEYFGRYYSVYRGIVYDNEDPEFMGRLRVTVPQIFGTYTPKKWATAAGAIAGKKGGIFWVPSVGDPIYVMFENGDSSRPLWLYGWWLDGSTPEDAKRKKPDNYVFQTPSGHRIEMDDKNNYIRVENNKGLNIEISADGFFVGTKEGDNLGALLQELFTTFESTTTIGYPFDNKIKYTALKNKFNQLILSNAVK